MRVTLCPKNAKIGEGATIHLWSDAHAYTIIKVTPSTITLQRDIALLNPKFTPNHIPGGFGVTNQNDQTYTYEPDPTGKKITLHWSKRLGSYGGAAGFRVSMGRNEFYDYNF